MRIGAMLPFSDEDGPGRLPTWAEISAFATHAEAVGLDSLWASDHVLSGSMDEPTEAVHESWTIVSALAATTIRIGLGQLVMCVSYRSPALLAKMAVTADEVSGGRLTLGVGAGWYEPEYRAFGWPFDHRVARFDEALQIIRPLLAGKRVTLDGRFHQVRDAVLLPPPPRPIPVLIAGNRPRMLRLTATYADAWNTAWYWEPDDRLYQRLADLTAALDTEQRDPATLRRTVGLDWDSAKPDRGVDDLARVLDAYDRLGIDELIVLAQPCTPESLDGLARAMAIR